MSENGVSFLRGQPSGGRMPLETEGRPVDQENLQYGGVIQWVNR